MKKSKKVTAILATALATLVCAVVGFSGCIVGADGKDGVGVNGRDLTITDVYEAYLAETGKTKDEYSLQQFIEERYGGYTNSELGEATSLQSTMNRSLMSSVSIIAKFNLQKQVYTNSGFMHTTVTNVEYTQYGGGSGVIVEMDNDTQTAYVVTNCHVVYNYSAVDQVISTEVRMYMYGQDTPYVNYNISYDQDKYNRYGVESQTISGDENYVINATVVGASINYDIALLKVTGSDYKRLVDNGALTAAFSTEDVAAVGSAVYAIGNANAQGLAVTQGIVSHDSESFLADITDTGNNYRSYRVLRMDAAINGGNSGGGLFNANGQIVGIVNGKIESSEIDNMCYALAASTVRRVVANLRACESGAITKPSFSRAYLGITTEVTNSRTRLVEKDGQSVAECVQTVSVVSVVSGSVAENTIQAGDIIRTITVNNGETKEITRDFMITDQMLEVLAAGDTVTVTWLRDGQEMSATFTIRSGDFSDADT